MSLFHRVLRKTRPSGKGTLLRPYAPLGAIRSDDDVHKKGKKGSKFNSQKKIEKRNISFEGFKDL